MAYKMSRKGSSVAEIQKAIDLNWGPKYPFFEQPSDQIKKYWKTRLWAKGNGPTPAEKHNDETPLYDPFTGTQEKNSKPMGKAEDCCGKKDLKDSADAKNAKDPANAKDAIDPANAKDAKDSKAATTTKK